jgi:hypothetical protein
MKTVNEETYIKANKGNKCPNQACQSTDIDGGAVNIDGIYASQEVSCNNCNATWEDTYTLSDFKITEDGDTHAAI